MRLIRGSQSLVMPVYFVFVTACFQAREQDELEVAVEPISGPQIEVDAESPSYIEVGRVDTFNARVTGLTSNLIYTSSNPEIASVDSLSGVVNALTSGFANITMTATSSPHLQRSVQLTVVPVGAAPRPMSHAELVARTMNEVCKNEESKLLKVSTGINDIHEYHDCQRLIRNGKYESLVGIFAHDNVRQYPNVEYKDGKIAAVIVNYETKGPTMPYEPLGLQVGISCLILKFNKKGNPYWEAAVVPLPATQDNPDPECEDDMDWNDVPDAQKGLLEVRIQPDAADHDDRQDVAPPVARWDWDPTNKVNYMGVRCGIKRWCEIGDSGFTTLPALKTTSGNRNLYKGFYDQQFLSDENGVLSDVWGTVLPGDSAVRDKIQRNKRWHETAKVIMEAPQGSAAYTFYESRLHLNTVTAAGRVKGTGSLRIYSEGLNVGNLKTNWLMQVNGQSVGDGVMYHVRHNDQVKHRAKSTRWRWHEEDETVWYFCPEDGCCEMKRLY
jgi:hypothetical protein